MTPVANRGYPLAVKHMVKQQQMQWMPPDAHLLLQVRTQVLNDDWEATFRVTDKLGK